MKTLFVAWQSPDNRRGWYPVGRLDADPAEGLYRFQYIRGAKRAEAEGGFRHLVAFPLLEEVYESAELFPLFANRVLSPTRPEYKSLSDMLNRPETALDPLELLELAGGVRQTDHLEVFPALKADGEGFFATRFFVHGWRHLPQVNQQRLAALGEDEHLQVALETNNPATCHAVQVQTADYMVLGWAPRYLVSDLGGCLLTSGCDLKCRVIRVNHSNAANQWKLLVELSGFVPEGHHPMSGDDYELLTPAVPSAALRHELATAA
ncbi:MAG: hypothetical protein WAW39_17265 [Prosthecobacter sp.]|uniref:DNA-binding protein n=1 Tax=Prosthecobacter sp. TaxID=1965333 RepID=UPI003BB0D85E